MSRLSSPSGPVAQFRFDDAAGSESVIDDVGSYTATNHGIGLGKAGPFEGSKSGTFSTGDSAALPSDPLTGASAFTIEMWVKSMGSTGVGQVKLRSCHGFERTDVLLLTRRSPNTR